MSIVIVVIAFIIIVVFAAVVIIVMVIVITAAAEGHDRHRCGRGQVSDEDRRAVRRQEEQAPDVPQLALDVPIDVLQGFRRGGRVELPARLRRDLLHEGEERRRRVQSDRVDPGAKVFRARDLDWDQDVVVLDDGLCVREEDDHPDVVGPSVALELVERGLEPRGDERAAKRVDTVDVLADESVVRPEMVVPDETGDVVEVDDRRAVRVAEEGHVRFCGLLSKIERIVRRHGPRRVNREHDVLPQGAARLVGQEPPHVERGDVSAVVPEHQRGRLPRNIRVVRRDAVPVRVDAGIQVP